MSAKLNGRKMIAGPALVSALAIALSACAFGAVAPASAINVDSRTDSHAAVMTALENGLNAGAVSKLGHGAPRELLAANEQAFIGQTPWMTLDP